MRERIIGIDVHARSCTLAIVDPAGQRLGSMVIDTTKKQLISAVRSVRGRRRICIEEGTQSAWVYEILRRHAHEVVVTVPRRREGDKDDLRDAYALADDLRLNGIRTRVFKAPPELVGLQSAVRLHRMVVGDVVRVKNRLSNLFVSRGIVASAEIYQRRTRKKWLKQLPKPYRRHAIRLCEELDHLADDRRKAYAWLLEERRVHPIVRILATAPGIGKIWSANIVSIVCTPHRFPSSREFWTYCGLGLTTHSSSNWIRKDGQWVQDKTRRVLGLNRRRQPTLHHIFKNAAVTVIYRMPTHPLSEAYQRQLSNGLKPNLARLTVARRIAAAILAMWRQNRPYDPSLARRRDSGKLEREHRNVLGPGETPEAQIEEYALSSPLRPAP